MKKISIIMPLYNCEKYIKRAISYFVLASKVGEKLLLTRTLL